MPLDFKVDQEDNLIGQERNVQSRLHGTANNPLDKNMNSGPPPS